MPIGGGLGRAGSTEPGAGPFGGRAGFLASGASVDAYMGGGGAALREEPGLLS